MRFELAIACAIIDAVCYLSERKDTAKYYRKAAPGLLVSAAHESHINLVA
jgi:hypothetical protein